VELPFTPDQFFSIFAEYKRALTVREGVPLSLTPIPIVWGFIGGSAAVLLQLQTDYVLLAAGVLLLMIVGARWIRWRPAVH